MCAYIILYFLVKNLLRYNLIPQSVKFRGLVKHSQRSAAPHKNYIFELRFAWNVTWLFALAFYLSFLHCFLFLSRFFNSVFE